MKNDWDLFFAFIQYIISYLISLLCLIVGFEIDLILTYHAQKV